MKYALEVIKLRRSFVFKPLAADLLWQRRLPASYSQGSSLDVSSHQGSATRRDRGHRLVSATDTDCAYRPLEY